MLKAGPIMVHCGVSDETSSSEFTMAPLSRCSVAPYNITMS